MSSLDQSGHFRRCGLLLVTEVQEGEEDVRAIQAYGIKRQVVMTDGL